MAHDNRTSDLTQDSSENYEASFIKSAETAIPNSFLRSNSISLGCLGLICYMYSYGNDHQFSTNRLLSHYKGIIGRQRLLKIIGEGIEAGFIKKNISGIIGKTYRLTYSVYIY